MQLEKQLEKALSELRKSKERKFDQTVDLIINLKNFDHKKNQINASIIVPFKIKDKKIAAFAETKIKGIDTITPQEFNKYSDKKNLKKLVKSYDFFISQLNLMPKVASIFGRVLGPAGKMPSPQLGIINSLDEKTIEQTKKRIENSIKLKIKEPSIKVAIGKQSMKDSEIIENCISFYNSILKILPKGKENIKNIQIKFTMSKPIKIFLK